jgi:GrpB-like predicted nucleotidyltransferase (UPF0157 family)
MATEDPILARSREVTVGEPEPAQVVVVEYDPAWPRRFLRERRRIVDALGDAALAVEHVGSTAVPGLAAKPIIDVLLVVADSSVEPDYLPALEAAGFELRIREPDWHEHRMLRTPDRGVHLHVFGVGSPEIDRLLAFRDRLRSNAGDRARYAATKRQLAEQEWPTVQHYADAKTSVIEGILGRAPNAR